MISSNNIHLPILNTLLRSFLPFIYQNQEWSRYVSNLGKIQKIDFIIENKPIREKQKCPLCQFVYQQNILILLIHLQIVHENDFSQEYKVKKYQLTYQGLQVHIMKKSSIDNKKQKQSMNLVNNEIKKDYFNRIISTDKNNSYQSTGYLMSNIKIRNNELLSRLFNRFTKRIQSISSSRQYYHSYNVFRQVRSKQSQEQNSQNQQCKVQIQLQKLRIHDFNDVSDYDKKLFLNWNLLMRQNKTIQLYFQKQSMIQLLKKFTVICKKQKIPKVNFIIHLWTLWSVGKIQSFDILQILEYFNQTIITQMKK